ncbi:hypothetical protein PENTCL1PPCAC_22315, partial [Pristionchus entomophagus]
EWIHLDEGDTRTGRVHSRDWSAISMCSIASRAIIVFIFFFILAFFALMGAHQSIRGRGSPKDTGNCSSLPVENR